MVHEFFFHQFLWHPVTVMLCHRGNYGTSLRPVRPGGGGVHLTFEAVLDFYVPGTGFQTGSPQPIAPDNPLFYTRTHKRTRTRAAVFFFYSFAFGQAQHYNWQHNTIPGRYRRCTGSLMCVMAQLCQKVFCVSYYNLKSVEEIPGDRPLLQGEPRQGC